MLNNPYIRMLLKGVIIDYLRGEYFSTLVVDQLSAILETGYTKELLADMIQMSFRSLLRDPDSGKKLIRLVKEYI